jgi:hypothetical protein
MSVPTSMTVTAVAWAGLKILAHYKIPARPPFHANKFCLLAQLGAARFIFAV